MKTEVMHENRSCAWKQKLCVKTGVMHENKSYAWRQELCMKTGVVHENRGYAWKQKLCMKTGVVHENRSCAWKQKLCMKTEVMHGNRSYAWKHIRFQFILVWFDLFTSGKLNSYVTNTMYVSSISKIQKYLKFGCGVDLIGVRALLREICEYLTNWTQRIGHTAQRHRQSIIYCGGGH